LDIVFVEEIDKGDGIHSSAGEAKVEYGIVVEVVDNDEEEFIWEIGQCHGKCK
jgi:hypothetical protein